MFKSKLSSVVIGVGLAFGIVNTASASGIPTVDVANIAQTTISAMKNVESVAKQVQQYQTQLEQYKVQLTNAKTIAQAQQIWQQANSTINQLQSTANSLKTMKQQVGNLDKVLDLYKNSSQYSQSNCFTKAGCTTAERARLDENRAAVIKLNQMANNDVMKTVEKQIDSILSDSQKLEQLQNSAKGAEGQMQALTSANQLIAHQSSQLLQMRQIMAAEAQAQAAYRQAQMDNEARETAASDKAWGQGKWKRN